MAEIRPGDSDEALQAALDLVRSVYPERAVTLAEARGYEESMPHGRFGAWDGDTLLASALVLAPPRLQERVAAFGSVVVLPEARGHGLGTQLYEAVSRWAHDNGLEQLEGNVKEGEDESFAWVERRGFVEIGRESMLELDLTQLDAPDVDPPDGIQILTWAERPELTRALYEVACEAYPDIPGNEDDAMEPFDDWLAHDMGGPGDRPEATFVAVAGDEVVAYAKFSLTEAQPTVAFHDITGVRRAWRGRGIAGALKRAEIRWAKENGYERLSTLNEERNAPIRKLNERNGYRRVPGRIFVRGPLAP